MDELKGTTIGRGPCPNCGNDAAYKVNKKGHIYVYCVVEADNGCHSGTQSRSFTGDKHLAKRIAKWANPDHRKKFLADEPEKEPAKGGWFDHPIL